MSSAVFFRRSPSCILRFFTRNYCSKSDEYIIPTNFKYSTSKILREERNERYKKTRKDGPKSNIKKHSYSTRDWENENLNYSNQVNKTDENVIRNIPEKTFNANEIFVSQDLMEAEGNPVRKKRTSIISQFSKSEKKSYPRVESKASDGEMLFGISPVSMALRVKRRQLYQLFVKKDSSENPRISAIRAQATDLNIPVETVDVDTLNYLSNGRPHQGVCLDAGMLFFEKETDERIDPSRAKEQPLCVFMDKIQDPMNLGAVLRSCYYFGIDRVYAASGNTCRLTPIVSKASSGAMEMMSVCAVDHPTEFLTQRIKKGWNVIGSASADALKRENLDPRKIVDLNDFVCPKPMILLVGNEGEGIDSELIRFCDQIVTISNGGNGDMLSLNVSVATGIFLHHCCSQLLPNSASRQSSETVCKPSEE